MICYDEALENIDTAIWYIKNINNDEEECASIVKPLEEAKKLFKHCRNELCTKCGEFTYAHEDDCLCDRCIWGE
jgi:hypothetical protein